jgi:[protein-PII] uridylyltransferase
LFLIERHLDMSRLMTTRDPKDATTTAALAALVGTVERLKMLTILTYSDISSVNPTALTPWRATLLWQTYAATERKLTLDLQEPTADRGLPVRYRLTHTTEEIDEHQRMEREGRKVSLDSFGDQCGDQYRLTVVTRDRSFLISDAAGALAGFGMNILRAEAFVNDRHTAIDTFVFSDPMRTLALNPSEVERFCQVVDDVVAQRRNSAELLRARPRALRRGRIATRVSVDTAASKHATLFEISAEDRPGILYELARCLSESGCNIETVLVDTEGQKAIDVFYVTRNGGRLEDREAAEVRKALEEIAV